MILIEITQTRLEGDLARLCLYERKPTPMPAHVSTEGGTRRMGRDSGLANRSGNPLLGDELGYQAGSHTGRQHVQQPALHVVREEPRIGKRIVQVRSSRHERLRGVDTG